MSLVTILFSLLPKKSIKIFSLVITLAIIFSNLSLASSFSDYENAENDKTGEIVGTIEEGTKKAADTVNSLAYTVVEQISDKSLPVCVILMLWGSIQYFILGIRNLYKKRQGMLLMWGAFTFLVIAKIVNFIFFIFTKIA